MLDELLTRKTAKPTGAESPIRTVTTEEAERAAAVVLMGFSTDPAARWMYPEAGDYLTHFPKFIEYFAGQAFETGGAFRSADFSGAALWLRPGVHPDEDAVIRLIEETVADDIKDEMFAMFEQMGNFHPAEPHWYLPMIGVDTFQQCRGIGSALMKHVLEFCDRERMTAYLESSNPRNISLYERHGFEAVGRIQVGSSPPITPMVRNRRS